MYASPAWSGFTSQEMKSRIEAMLKKSKRWGLTGGVDLQSFSALSDVHDRRLFLKIQTNPIVMFCTLSSPL